MLTADELCARLPHAPPMCLLDRLLSWDPGSVICTARSHRDPDNPLRRDGRLAAIHAVEYACQAAALHATLAPRETAGRPSRSLLAAVKEIRLFEEYLDQIPAPLRISAWRDLTLGPSAIYRFLIEAAEHSVAQGRLTVVGGLGL